MTNNISNSVGVYTWNQAEDQIEWMLNLNVGDLTWGSVGDRVTRQVRLHVRSQMLEEFDDV